jgi:hypothetical protein
MKSILSRWLPTGIALAALIGILAGFLGIPRPIPAFAKVNTTTSLTITKYASDGATIISQVTVDYASLEAGTAVGSDGVVHATPIQGDGVLHYFTQGPTFDPNNLWDPDEDENLKDKGAPKGTDLKDLCGLVGGATSKDGIQVCASDDYGNTVFPYENVYAPDPRQGKMVICWYDAGQGDESVPSGYVPAWTNGMLLVFFAETTNADGQHVFGHQDMRDCLPEDCWHFYYNKGIQYPSTNGGYIKYVNRINILTDASPSWNVDLHGARDHVMDRAWFENAISASCHGTATYNDSEGNLWSGLPLWYTCGIVDDALNIHGPGAFDDNLYYDVKVIGRGNYSYTFPSTTVARDNCIILANKLNNIAFSDTYHPEYFPLKLVSASFKNDGPSVEQVSRIELLNINSTPSAITPIPAPFVADWPLQMAGRIGVNLSQGQFQSCIQCHPSVSYTDGTNTWSGIPLWRLLSQVDDKNKHGITGFNSALATKNYAIKVYAADNSLYTFYSDEVAHNNEIIVANKLNGVDLPAVIISGDPPVIHPAGPLIITGPDTSGSSRIGAVVRFELVFPPGPAWDLNYDLTCDVGDIVILGLQWGKTGADGWMAEDLNKDGAINVGDVVALGRHWGQTW